MEHRVHKWKKDATSLHSDLTEKDEQVGDLIQRAEEMLKGATNAGLASTFNRTLAELDGKLKWAQGVFYFSILSLFVSALPLALYLFDPQTVKDSGGTKGVWGNLALSFSGDLSLSNTIALFLLLVPAVWLTKFSAARHHQLFQLKEHYQYKYSLAMAVDGFKKQAPEHADAIAAETFNRLYLIPLTGWKAKAHPTITQALL